MRATWISLLALTLFVSTVQLSSQQAPQPGQQTAPAVDFAAEVQPIFKTSCYACHSGLQPQAGLRLDVRSMALKGGNGGPVILPGNSTDSPLIHRVSGLGGLRPMPLTGTPLTSGQIAILTRWIDQGAQWPDVVANEQNAGIQKHWAYVKPVRPAIPAVTDTKWVRNPIDSFVLARLEKEGLRPTREANREMLIRRVSLDLIGLPPTIAEVDAFVNDKRPDAYERLVDRLLASPQYGVRMATPWLDLARYADSNGMTNDRRRLGAYPYRDWVVKALNANMPFDRFVIEQLAGDMLPNATIDQKVATGFVRASMWNDEGGTDPDEQNWIGQIDRTNTVGTALLGSTLLCAQCHNHKYDPFLQKDYYAMVAFFNNAQFDPTAQRKFTEATIELSSPEQVAKRDALKAEIKKVESQLKSYPNTLDLWKGWERSLLEADAQWQALSPTRAESPKGSTLTVSQDASVLVSGAAPENDIYVIDAKSPLTGAITGIQIEALLDPSLPNGRDPAVPTGGPGRDFYGNFMVQRVEVEAGPSAEALSKVAIKPTVNPAASDEFNQPEYQIQYRLPQLWRSDVMLDLNPEKGSGGMRVPRRLVVVPQKPFTVTRGDALRVRIVHDSELAKAALGRFRLSVTTQADPLKVVEIDAHVRPLLNIPWEQRPQPKPKEMAASGQGGQGQGQPSGQAKVQEQPQAPYEKDLLLLRWREVAPGLAPMREKIADLQEQIDALNLQPTPILSENPAIQHPTTQLRIRGVFTDGADDVSAAVPAFLGALPKDGPQNRLAMARWVVGPENPLTGRVRVNQIWEVFFGRGIVETSEDFGVHSSGPSHPDLLDWLTTEFVSQGWDQKAIQRLIVTSNTYRQASTVTPELLDRDPANVLFTRGPRFRVEAEMVRDIALAASGLLSTKTGGPPVMPPQPAGLWVFPGQDQERNTDLWIESQGEDKYRRALYTFVRRSVRYPSLMVFDAPSHETTTVRRARSNTPLQALTALNDPAFFEAAQALGRRILEGGGTDTSSRATYGFRLATSRRPTALELKSLVAALEKERQYFQGHQDEAQSLAGKPDGELAAWTMVSNALLNLDETMTKE
jgi:hypothetical protein